VIGNTLGHYQITSQLGKGGMGEVYQAKDQRLGRDVAIKVLPEEFAKDADRVARFQREAKLLASLNHPNIAAIYGLEESGKTNFLVLELVEGDTLADQIKKGPIPVEESLKLALQITEALEAAHEKGVIHRDLKPANIKVTPEGKVKVLDFGLAKAFAGDQEELNLSNSPTLSNAATQMGVILGTAAYMSPEQAKGKTVDKRADIWAFGCVVYEMLTGRSLFSADDVSQTLARVLERQPDFSFLPPNLHPKIIEMLERCLEKDVRNRYSSVSDARVDIQKVLADPRGVLVEPDTKVESRTKLRMILPWIAAAVILTAIIAGVAIWKLKPSEPRPVMRFDYELPEGQVVSSAGSSGASFLAISPDGRQFAYGTPQGIFLRSMGDSTARLIAGTEGGLQQPFFSPDGKWIGYWSRADSKLKKVAVSGGAPIVLCEVEAILGATWHKDNTIVFCDSSRGIMRVSADGGTPEAILRPKAGLSALPQFLPDGKSVLYTSAADTIHRKTAILSIESGKSRELFEGIAAQYLPTGHILYRLIDSNTVCAIPFDPRRLEITGRSIPILQDVRQFAVSDTGTLLYVQEKAGTVTPGRALVWVDRNGKEESIGFPPNAYSSPAISPDGTQLALAVGGGRPDIRVCDLVRKTVTPLTRDAGSFPLWTPDGKRIAFTSIRDGNYGIYWRNADGTGKEEPLATLPPRTVFPWSWSNRGKILVLMEGMGVRTGLDIGALSMEGDRKYTTLLQEAYNEVHPKVSPNGKWMAFATNESGKYEVYIRPFPDVDSNRMQVSTNGGDSPLWSPDGRELFYRNGAAVMAVSVKTEPKLNLEIPKTLFQGSYVTYVSGSPVMRPWDISPDGKRFLMIKSPLPAGETSAAEGLRKINIVLNWFEELKQRVPVK
jgi:serine/threonine protein kinase/Tol biopolymer transport system component